MSGSQGGTSVLAAPPGVRELLTSTWRFWLWPGAAPTDMGLLYITAAPESLDAVCHRALQAVLMTGAPAPAAMRLVRSGDTLAHLNSLPDWAGKAITFYMAPQDLSALAQELDGLLVGQGLQGPPVLRARPFGGASGMLFLHTVTGAGRQSKLERLLGCTDA